MMKPEMINKTALREWIINAWIHPNTGGDDYLTTWKIDTTGFGNQPSDMHKLAKKLIQKEDSAILNDYEILLNGCKIR